MTRKTIRKIVKITFVMVILAIATALTSCSMGTTQATKSYISNNEHDIHSFLTATDIQVPFSELWKLS